MKEVILAYSGGLDTSVSVHKLVESGFEVTALTVDIGQKENLEEMKQKALKLGAKKAIVIDATEEFVSDYITPAIFANALYENAYVLSTSIARPLIVKKLAEYAKEKGIKTIAHGCKGKGSDFTRFYLYIKQLYPDSELTGPIAEWNPSRVEEAKYAEEHSIPIPVSSSSPYSYDDNIWGNSINYGKAENSWIEYPVESLTWSAKEPKEESKTIEIEFLKGIPIKIDGKQVPLLEIIKLLNKIGSEFAVGITDLVEDQTHGGKGRYVYEAPGAQIIIAAHKKLESLTLPKSLLFLKGDLDKKWTEICYDVFFFSPVKKAIDAFMKETQEYVKGTVKIKLSAGKIDVIGVKSDTSLYHKSGKKVESINGYENIKFSEANPHAF